ncbi:hypothetical protein HR060_10730 [Catenovulum sp. SM1970]|uniref:major capsid protein P2 n=1 Tax=Marinifaba aquimaris TaxID=2741323 RepID=UPI0015729A7E|nr:major capsid protein P2 [Marinifaba aquimaris]NTS77339.1 hypothetical protein [Marinifaba aquimaris]
MNTSLKTSYRPMSRDLSPFNKIGSNLKGSVKLDVGMTYHQIQLIGNITDPTLIEQVELKLNGEVIKTYTGEQLVMLEKYKKQPAQAGRYIFPLANIDARNVGGIMTGALVTYATDELILYVKFADLSSVSTPELRARAFWLPNQFPRKFIPRSYETTLHLPKSGKNSKDWERDARKSIQRLHMLPDKGAIERLEIHRDNKIEFEADKTDIDYDLTSIGGQHAQKAPQTDYLHFDTGASGFVEKGLFPTAAKSHLRFSLFATEADTTVTVLVEELEVVS